MLKVATHTAGLPDPRPHLESVNGDDTLIESLIWSRLSQLKINDLYKKGSFSVPIHLGFGHESLATALVHNLENDESAFLSHRNIHYHLARSGDTKALIQEYLLSPHGKGNGRKGSMNLDDPGFGFPYTSSILGNNFALACGMALGKSLKGEKKMTVVVTGDGAIEEGGFYEALELSKSLNLALLVVVENNGWSLASRIHERRCDINLEKVAESFGAAYLGLAGNDVFQYSRAINHFKKRLLSQSIPGIIEVTLTSLGGWILRNESYPEGKYINYHAGPAPEVDGLNEVVLQNDSTDPIYVLKEKIGSASFARKVGELQERLERELNDLS